jgi:hypothetical protein
MSVIVLLFGVPVISSRNWKYGAILAAAFERADVACLKNDPSSMIRVSNLSKNALGCFASHFVASTFVIYRSAGVSKARVLLLAYAIEYLRYGVNLAQSFPQADFRILFGARTKAAFPPPFLLVPKASRADLVLPVPGSEASKTIGDVSKSFTVCC